MITLYILPGDNSFFDDFKNAIESFLPVNEITVLILNHRDDLIKIIQPKTKWWGFLFGNEWIDNELAESLNTHLKYNTANKLVLFKIVRCRDGVERAFIEDRIFRTDIIPVQGVECVRNVISSSERILDGWLRETDRI